MRTLRKCALGLSCAANLLLMAAGVQAQEIGLTVLVQPWTPETDDDQAYTLLRDDALISNLFQSVVTLAKPATEQFFVDYLQRADLLTEGVTLYDMTLEIGLPTLALEAISGGGDTPASFAAAVRFGRIHLDARATTPDIARGIGLDGELDPHCSIDFGLEANLPVSLSQDPSQPLQTDGARGPLPLAHITSLGIDSSNFSCDVIVALLSLTGIEDKLRELVTDPNGELAWAIDDLLRPALKSAFDDANAEVRAVVLPGLQLRSWASSSMLTLAFAPGQLTFDELLASTRGMLISESEDGALSSHVEPDEIAVKAYAKVGPRTLLRPNGELDEQPLVELGTASMLPDPTNGASAFELVGLAANFPNYVTLGSHPHCQQSDMSSVVWRTEVRGFNPGVLLPAQLSSQLELVAESYSDPCGAKATAVPESEIPWRVDPPYIDKVRVKQLMRH